MREFNYDAILAREVDLDKVRAMLKLHAEDKKICGIAVMLGEPKNGEFVGLSQVKNFSKRPINIGFAFGEGTALYGMTVDLNLSNREVVGDIELTNNIHIVSFKGNNRDYHAIVVLNDYMELRMPIQYFSAIAVAFSDKVPENGEQYECTVVEKCNDGSTAINRKYFNIHRASYYGNLALCETDGKPLLVTYPE